MKRTAVILSVLLCISWLQAMAQIDPEEILRQLPPPEVNYSLPEIKAVKPPVALPDQSYVEHYGRPKPSKKELERSVKKVRSLLEIPAVTSTVRLISNLARNDKTVSTSADNTSDARQPAGSAAQRAQTQTSQTQDKPVVQNRPRKPPVIEIPPMPADPPPTGKIMAAWKTLRQNPALAELEASLLRDRQLAEDTFAMALLMAEKKSEAGEQEPTDADSEDTGEAEGDEEQVRTGSHDAILAKAMGLYKKQDWKGLKSLFAENPDAAGSKDGLRYLIEAEINEAKPNYMLVRRNSDQLMKIEKDDAMANYGMALYYYNAKKPNTAKAQAHLTIALKAKNPPEGASAFYWNMTFKKFMIPLLVLIAAIIGGISQVIKKRKAAAALDSGQPAEQPETEKEAKPKGKLMQKLAPLLDKFKGILARFRKKPTASPAAEEAADIDVPADEAEPAEEEASATQEENTTEATEEEEEEEEEEEDENELESEDEEVIDDESEEETDEDSEEK